MCLEFDAICAASTTTHSDPPQFVTFPYQTFQTTTTLTPSLPTTSTSFDVSLDVLCAIISVAR